MKLMTHVVIGYPDLHTTEALVKTMVSAGADMIELQIPFSDPMADGVTIMHACEASLRNGTRVRDAFLLVKKLRKEITIPLYFMAYYNTVFRYGAEKFCKDAKESGITGLIVPDMPIEEESQEHFFAHCKKYNLENIRVVSPASTPERLNMNAKVGTGFIYATARQGITGVQDKNYELRIQNKAFISYIKRIREHFSIPIACGFGVSKPEHVKILGDLIDIVVVGSAIIDIINSVQSSARLDRVRDFITSVKMIE